jgi:hypothetical protein
MLKDSRPTSDGRGGGTSRRIGVGEWDVDGDGFAVHGCELARLLHEGAGLGRS